jgi:hypothetical protein
LGFGGGRVGHRISQASANRKLGAAL